MKIKILKEKEVDLCELSQKEVRTLLEDFCDDVYESMDYDEWVKFIKFGRKFFKKYGEGYEV